jgi:hypothetical protein
MMKSLIHVGTLGLGIALGMAVLIHPAFPAEEGKQGVYEYVVRKSPLSFEEASRSLDSAIAASDFVLAGKFDQAAPEDCGYRTRVFILYDLEYATRLVNINELTGPFAVADRINLFSDEDGLHVAVVNPHGINRTVLMDDAKYAPLSTSHREALRSLILGAVPGEPSARVFGPIRKKGYIGRTMGIMAGGRFDKKVENILVKPSDDLGTSIDKVKAEFSGEGKWGIKPVYTIRLDDLGIAIVGLSSPVIESRSFKIVKAGGDKARKSLSCPGIAHAAAYPIELVLTQKKTVVWVRVLDIMYRMKMYFEDAGKMAFAKNMGMPGSIKGEIKRNVKRAFEARD